MKTLIVTLFAAFLGTACCSKSNALQADKDVEKVESKEIVAMKEPKQQGRRGAFRTVEGNKIIRTFDASQIPFTIGEEFTDENQQFVILIKNVTQPTLSAKINTVEKIEI